MEEQVDFNEETISNIVEKLISPNRNCSILELQSRINYLSHARANPTKSIEQATKYLYEAIDELKAFVGEGTGDKDIALIRSIHQELVNKKILPSNSRPMLEFMLKAVTQKRDNDQIPQGSGLCFATSPDNRQFLITEVPQRIIY